MIAQIILWSLLTALLAGHLAVILVKLGVGQWLVEALRLAAKLRRCQSALRRIVKHAPKINPQFRHGDVKIVLFTDANKNQEHGYRCARWHDAQIAKRALEE